MKKILSILLILFSITISAKAQLRHIPGISFFEAEVSRFVPSTARGMQLSFSYGFWKKRDLSIRFGLVYDNLTYHNLIYLLEINEGRDSLLSYSSSENEYRSAHLQAGVHCSLADAREKIFLGFFGALRAGLEKSTEQPNIKPSWGIALGPELEIYLAPDLLLIPRLKQELIFSSALLVRTSASLSLRYCLSN